MSRPPVYLVSITVTDPKSGLSYEETTKVRADLMKDDLRGNRGTSDHVMQEVYENISDRIQRMMWRAYGTVTRRNNEANRQYAARLDQLAKEVVGQSSRTSDD